MCGALAYHKNIQYRLMTDIQTLQTQHVQVKKKTKKKLQLGII